MPKRRAEATWKGTLKEGQGWIKTESDELNSQFGFASRFENGKGTNPEELIGAAHAACFSQAFALELGNNDFPPTAIDTTADVSIEKRDGGFAITKIELKTKCDVPGIDKGTFEKIAQGAKENCPVSKALAATEITLETELVAS
ncbi:MAG: OsmC family protein [Spirochaetales bacterium]